MQQFRFLDVVVSTDVLSNNLEQILESCPAWFQNDLLAFLPDLVTDKQHQAIAEMLNKIMEENPDLTAVILDCMGSLNLSNQYMNEYRQKVLGLMKTNVKMDIMPTIIKYAKKSKFYCNYQLRFSSSNFVHRFALDDCVDPEYFKKMIAVLRTIDIQPLAGENVDNCYKHQLEIINTIKMTMLTSKNIVNTTLAIIKDINKDPKPLDMILLLLIYHTATTKKKMIESTIKQYIKSGFYRPSLLSLLYNDYKKVWRIFQIRTFISYYYIQLN